MLFCSTDIQAQLMNLGDRTLQRLKAQGASVTGRLRPLPQWYRFGKNCIRWMRTPAGDTSHLPKLDGTAAQFITVAQLGELLDVSRATAYRIVQLGAENPIAEQIIRGDRQTPSRIPMSAIVDYIEEAKACHTRRTY